MADKILNDLIKRLASIEKRLDKIERKLDSSLPQSKSRTSLSSNDTKKN